MWKHAALLTALFSVMASMGCAQRLPVSLAQGTREGTGATVELANGSSARSPVLLMANTTDASSFVLPALPLSTPRTRAIKLMVWVKAEQASGDSYAALELLAAGEVQSVLKRTGRLHGDTPGFVAQWLVADLPAETPATHWRVALHSDGNAGKVWFRDLAVTALPPNEPVVDGPVAQPARGPITAAGGHLVDQSGRRIRFWGVNCVDELGRDYREITQIVRRIKQMGFNAIRLHLYDIRLIDTEAKTAGEPTSRLFRRAGQRGDASRLDLMDYFIYRAEREGLYLYLTLDRGRGHFCPGDYDILPSAGAEDEKQWKEAVAATNKGWANEHLYFVDERLGAAHAEYARQQLAHRNAYTGRMIAADPWVALWELTNENAFPLAMLNGGWRQWPDYFQRKVQRRWNEWLEERYRSTGELVKAWGELREAEQLETGSIQAAPHDGEAEAYPPTRQADFRRFVYDLTLAHCRRLEQIIREAGPISAKAPISYDTIFEHKHAWYYPMSQGSFQAVGQYVGGPLELAKDKSFLGLPPKAIYNYGNATVADKPMVVYENNIHKPAADRAYYPVHIAAFASTHDWDGVFWYVWSDGTVLDQVDAEAYAVNGLRYAAPSHIWHGIVIATDEALLASLRLAGQLFAGGTIPPFADPVTVTVGAEALFGRSTWIGDIDVPFPPDAPEPYRRAFAQGATDFVHGTRYRYDPQAPQSEVSRPLIARVPELCSPTPGLTYDFQRGVILVDRPEAQAVVGFTGGRWRFDDGASIDAGACPFFCYGLVSQDGKPLSQSQRALLVFTAYGDNRGLKLREDPAAVQEPVPTFAKLIAGWGYGPPDMARPKLTFRWPRQWRIRPVDFQLRPISAPSQPVQEWQLPEGQQLFQAELACP